MDARVERRLDGNGDDALLYGRVLLFAALLALELRAEAGAESLLGVAHLNTERKLSIAGPRMTMNIAGKMKSTVGKSIFTGAFIAFSSAAA